LQWNLIKQGETVKWLSAKESSLLWVQGRREIAPIDWTTILSVEVSTIAQDIPETTVLAFFCSSRNLGLLNTPGVILQAFIVQLIAKHIDKFNNANLCHRHVLSLCRLELAEDNFVGLWSIFTACLEISGARCIYMFIDNVDELNAPTQKFGNTTDLDLFFDFLDGLSKSSSPLCKILITSRQIPGSGTDVSEIRTLRERFNQQHYLFLQIPHFHERRVLPIKERQVERLPDRRSRASITFADFEKWLDRQDAGLPSTMEDASDAVKLEEALETLDESDDFDEFEDYDFEGSTAVTKDQEQVAPEYKSSRRKFKSPPPGFGTDEELEKYLADTSSESGFESSFDDDDYLDRDSKTLVEEASRVVRTALAADKDSGDDFDAWVENEKVNSSAADRDGHDRIEKLDEDDFDAWVDNQ
jgi:hypothetical protein